MERRLGHRLDHHTHVSLYATRGSATEAEIQDLSLSGAFVRTEAPLPPSSKIQLTFPGRPAEKAAAIDAWVVRTATDGVGVEWAQFAPRPVSTLLFAHWTREAAEQARSQAAR